MPGVATAAIVGFLNVYNELPIANVILTKTENRTISVALLAFQGDYQTSLSLIFASIVIVIIPILIFYGGGLVDFPADTADISHQDKG